LVPDQATLLDKYRLLKTKEGPNCEEEKSSFEKESEMSALKNLVYDLAKKVDRLGRSNRTRSPTPPRSPQRRNRTRCYACNEDGHFANDCPHKKVTEVKSESKKEKSLNA